MPKVLGQELPALRAVARLFKQPVMLRQQRPRAQEAFRGRGQLQARRRATDLLQAF